MRNLWLALYLLLGLAPAQAQGVDPTVNPPAVFPGVDGASLFVRLEPTQVFWDDFGTGTLDITNRWNAPTTSGGGTAASNAVGFSTLGSGTTASGWSKLTSIPTFVGRNPGYITIQHQINIEFPVLTNAYRFWGMGSIPGSPTTTSPMTNAVGWAIDTSGKLRAQTWASGSINFNADLSVVQSGPQLCNCVGQPQDSSVHKYQIYFRGDNILWFVDGKPVARVNTGAGGPDVNTLGVAAVTVAGTTPPTSTATITLNQVTIGDSSRNATAIRDATLPWLQMKVNADGSIAAGGVSVSNASSGVASTSTNAPTVSYNYAYNGTTWDQLKSKPASTAALNTDTAVVVDIVPRATLATGTAGTPSASIVTMQGIASMTPVQTFQAPSAGTSAGITPVVCGSAVSSCVLKASAGNLYSVYANCTAACWLMVFNATAAPSNGATTAGAASGNMVECIPIGAGGVGSIANTGVPPSIYTVGMTAAISSTACATLTLSTVGMINGKVF